jgi:hypothetical protein
MRDRLLERRAAEGLVAGLAPPFACEIVEAGLSEMMCDSLGLGGRAIAQRFRRSTMQRLGLRE